MRTLFLHIGSHKTGTTAIQNALFSNRENIAQSGVKVFNRGLNGHALPHANGTDWIPLNYKIRNGHPSKILASLIDTKLLFKYLADCDRDVIFSAESLSWLDSADEIHELKEEAQKYFDRVIIIVYVRRQDRQVISHHNQGSKYKFTPASIYYGSSNRSIPINEDNYYEYLDYNRKITLWADAFGDENIRVRVFERDFLFGNDVVEDFFNLIGIPYDNKEGDTNLSTGFEAAKIGHLVNEHLCLKMGRMIKRSSDHRGKLMPSRAAAESFYSIYAESNRKLNQRFNISPLIDIFNGDFSDYPTEAQDLWSEDTANQAISNILKTFDRAYGHLTIKKLKAIALLVEDTDASLAGDILATINALNPHEDSILKD
jgi:hypothetical protein